MDICSERTDSTANTALGFSTVVTNHSVRLEAQPVQEEPARVRKLGEKIAERIIADIVSRGWPVNENLGTERELLTKYGIARATFREAIRQVERHGAANMRRGAGGGLIVCERPRAAAVRAMLSFFELTRVSFADQHETREQLEVAAARLAAERIDADSVARILEIVHDLKGEGDYAKNVAGNMRVRVAIAEATGNPALALFIEVLNGVLREILRVLRIDEAVFQRDRVQSVDFKQTLIGAIARRDGVEAERLVLSDAHRRLLAMTSAITRPPSDGGGIAYGQALPVWWESDQPNLKLSDQVVYRMVNDIAKLGWKEGHNLGKEADLQPLYGVSRAVLREAIRQLELHGIARMKTGLQGGLIISRIDPAYTVELVTTYLKSTPIDVMHLWETQSGLEVFAAGRLAQVADTTDRDALIRLMSRLEAAPTERFLEVANVLHSEIADRTGNRAVSLFVRILARYAGEVCPPVRPEDMPWLIKMHQRIVTAICDRDFVAARRCMTQLFDRARVWIAAAHT